MFENKIFNIEYDQMKNVYMATTLANEKISALACFCNETIFARMIHISNHQNSNEMFLEL